MPRDDQNGAMSDHGLIEELNVELVSGTTMPLLGLGTWQARGRSAIAAVRSALELGYRHIDTATMYGNENEVGQAVAESGVPRAEIFVTTKLPQSHAGRERETLVASLAALGLEYVDLWLIHWPPGGRARPEVWERLLELEADGLAREVGVSNYSLRQIDELQRATGRLPAVNQIEWSPGAVRPGRAGGASPPPRAARGVQPSQDDEPSRRHDSSRSRTSTASPRRRSSSAGTSSTGSPRSRSRRTPTASPRTPRSSTSS